MRFFVPLSNDPHHGEDLYNSLRHRLSETKGAEVAGKRIYALKFQEDGRRRTIAVGGDFQRLEDGPVMAIFLDEATPAYYVCTPKHGGFEGEPYPIHEDGNAEIEEFSALA